MGDRSMSETADGTRLMGTGGDLIGVWRVSGGIVSDSKTEFELAKGESFPIPVKAVGSAKR